MVNFTLNPDAPKQPLGAGIPENDPLLHPELYEGVLSKRIFAYVIDVIFISLIVSAVWFVLGLLGIVTFGATFGLMGLAVFIIPFVYHTYLIGGSESATFGMRIMKVEVRSWVGGEPYYPQAAVQTILFYGSVALSAWFILLVALFGSSRRCFHDYLSGTVVVNKIDGLVSGIQIKKLTAGPKTNEA